MDFGRENSVSGGIARSGVQSGTRKRTLLLHTVGFMSLLGLAACASSDALQLSEHPDYARAVGAGCATAREEEKSFSTKRFGDDESFENSRAYRAGWRQGYLECKSYTRERNDGGRILGNEDRF